MKTVYRGLVVLLLLPFLGLSPFADYEGHWAGLHDAHVIAWNDEMAGVTMSGIESIAYKRRNSMGRPSPSILERRLLDPDRRGEQWLPHA